MKYIAGVLMLFVSIMQGTCFAQDAKPASLPPVVSFLFAGPLAMPSNENRNEMTMQSKFVLAIHTIDVDRIEIIDTDTQEVLVDDVSPKLADSKLKIPGALSFP